MEEWYSILTILLYEHHTWIQESRISKKLANHRNSFFLCVCWMMPIFFIHFRLFVCLVSYSFSFFFLSHSLYQDFFGEKFFPLCIWNTVYTREPSNFFVIISVCAISVIFTWPKKSQMRKKNYSLHHHHQLCCLFDRKKSLDHWKCLQWNLERQVKCQKKENSRMWYNIHNNTHIQKK